MQLGAIEPKFPKQKIAIVTATSEEYLAYFCVTLSSLISHAKKDRCYDFVILGDGISQQSQMKVEVMARDIPNISIRFIDVSSILKEFTFPNEHIYKAIIYVRLAIPELFRNYERAIYVDADMVFCTDISELYDKTFNGNLVLGVRDTGLFAWYNTPGNKEREYILQKLCLKEPEKFLNSGLLVFNIALFRKTYTFEQIFRFATSKKWRWRDQDVLMKLCDGKIGLLAQQWNVLLPSDRNDEDLLKRAGQFELLQQYQYAKSNPFVLHFIGTSFLKLDVPNNYSMEFWKYARKTPAYEVIFQRALVFTLKNNPEYMSIFSEYDYELHKKAADITLNMFASGNLGFRLIIKYAIAWLKFKTKHRIML